MNSSYVAWFVIVIVAVGAAYFVYKNAHVPLGVTDMLVVTDQNGRYMDINTYVRTNISTLSPIKETVGGTFYITSLETHGGAGTVSYEDGHNAYTADFIYTVAADGRPSVSSWSLRQASSTDRTI